MKLDSLFAQFLAEHKKLDLPGIGSIFYDRVSETDAESGKTSKLTGTGNLVFVHKTSLRESPELVQFIASETGKQKALAASDLDSFLELAQQFLNIGKPFMLEGIGSFNRSRSGELIFTPGQPVPEMMKDNPDRDSSLSQETHPDYKSILYQSKIKTGWKKPVAIILVAAGLAFAIWGGYTIYKRTVKKNKTEIKNTDNPSVTDTLSPTLNNTPPVQKDTGSTSGPGVNSMNTGSYKYILEISSATRAFDRFERLKKFQWPVYMETTDSVIFKIFLRLPAPASDTTRMLDSLSKLNGKRVFIEK